MKNDYFLCFDSDQGDKVFLQSAKSKHMRRSQALNRLWHNEPSGSGINVNPSPGLVAPSRQSRTSFEDREVITSNTRSIAALAAKKRGRAQPGPLGDGPLGVGPSGHDKSFISAPRRPLYRPLPLEPTGSAPALTSSRLAEHNQMTEGVFRAGSDALIASDDNLSQNTLEKTSIHTETSIPPLTGGGVGHRVKKADPLEDSNKRKTGYSQHVRMTWVFSCTFWGLTFQLFFKRV